MAAYQAGNPNDGSIGNDAVWDDLETMNDDVREDVRLRLYLVRYACVQ